MSRALALSIDVADPTGCGEPAHIAFAIQVPDRIVSGGGQVVCFAKPGGGYTKEYYSMDLPGPGTGAGSQAAFHADRGWIFVSVDYVGIGESSRHDLTVLDTASMTAASVAAEAALLDRLRRGTLDPAIPALPDLVVLGIGQSLGGSMTIYQQGEYDCYDGIASLAYSPLHQNASGPPGSPTYVSPYLNAEIAPNSRWNPETSSSDVFEFPGPISDTAIAWSFFYFEDTDWDLIVAEVDDFPFRHGKLARWHTPMLPFAAANDAMTPGRLAPQAAKVRSPVLVIMGERDNVVDPWGEPRAFARSTSVDLFICARMAHMHNFAGTREIFWRRIHSWGEWVRECVEIGGYHDPGGSAAGASR